MQISAYVNIKYEKNHMISDRLKSERKRLELTQKEFGELAGAKNRTVIDWEKGVSSPTAIQLEWLADAGLDVNFVVTGKSQEIAEDLTADEQILIGLYRDLPVSERRKVLLSLLSGDGEKTLELLNQSSDHSRGDHNNMTITGDNNVQISSKK